MDRSGNDNFDYSNMNFDSIHFSPSNMMDGVIGNTQQPGSQMADDSFLKPIEGETSFFFTSDEAIDTTQYDMTNSQQPVMESFAEANLFSYPQESGYALQQNLIMDNTMGNASWSNQLSPAIVSHDDFASTPTHSFSSTHNQYNNVQKRPLQLDTQDFPQPKRQEFPSFSPFAPTTSSITGSSWTADTQQTPSSSIEIGLSDEAADVCAMWFSKYAVLPSDRHIESLSQLTEESPSAIRHWFGQMLRQGMAGHDSAYKSQTSLSHQDQLMSETSASREATSQSACKHDTASTSQALRGGKKGCTPTEDPEVLGRDPNKIYQCTRKCGKRYGRKCDWKRNEEEGYPSKSWMCSLCLSQGVEKVKPCFRKYHFSQHFRNIHPGFNAADYEADSVVHSATAFPQKCGFCPHRFTSRQDRIDHIAEHFKKGKCMLDWNDDEDDDNNHGSDDGDDDDRPDGDGSDSLSNDPSEKQGQNRPGSKQNGNGGNNERGGRQPPSTGYGQFQASQFGSPFNDNDIRGQSSGVDLTDQSSRQSCFIQCPDGDQRILYGPNSNRHVNEGPDEDEQYVHGPKDHIYTQRVKRTRGDIEAAEDDSGTLAGNAVSNTSMNTGEQEASLNDASDQAIKKENDPDGSDQEASVPDPMDPKTEQNLEGDNLSCSDWKRSSEFSPPPSPPCVPPPSIIKVASVSLDDWFTTDNFEPSPTTDGLDLSNPASIKPEKCPVAICEYYVKSFAGGYGKNRHTLTHYQGTMVCGFCPGSSSDAEKSFNRAIVFKRHLTAVHGVEQNPPNAHKSRTSRKSYSGAQNVAGTCSICSVLFANAQEFYGHLDDCILNVVQQQHEKNGSQGWQFPEERSEYSVLGLSTENERGRHYSEQPSLSRLTIQCSYPRCPFKFKLESNPQKHMRKAHSGADNLDSLVIGIDCGTTFSGVARAVLPDLPNAVDILSEQDQAIKKLLIVTGMSLPWNNWQWNEELVKEFLADLKKIQHQYVDVKPEKILLRSAFSPRCKIDHEEAEFTDSQYCNSELCDSDVKVEPSDMKIDSTKIRPEQRTQNDKITTVGMTDRFADGDKHDQLRAFIRHSLAVHHKPASDLSDALEKGKSATQNLFGSSSDQPAFEPSSGIRASAPGRVNHYFKISSPSFSIEQDGGACADGPDILTNSDIFANLSKGQFSSNTDSCKKYGNDAMGFQFVLNRNPRTCMEWHEVNLTGNVGTTLPDFYQRSQSFLSVKLLGTGGFSTVDEVVHRETNLRISRKTLKNREQSAIEELKREVGVLQKLRHPHIIRFLGAVSKGDKVSILLTPIAETSLAIWLDKCMVEQPAGLAETIVKMYGCLASSIRYLHAQRPAIKHMDIKPQNILVMQGNYKYPHVILSDFGISSSENHEGPSSKPLTRQYCAPEVPGSVARGPEADIWSLGCVFLEMAIAVLAQINQKWLEFRQEFCGCEGKCYWQDLPRLHDWLDDFLDQATTPKEADVLRTIKAMLSGEPDERPDAATLTIIFTPAPCCLSWPNENVSFPGPLEELQAVEMLVRMGDVDCLSKSSRFGRVNHQQEHECFERAKSWMHECADSHIVCRRQLGDPKCLPTRLLEIQGLESVTPSVRVVRSADLNSDSGELKYVTISHVWRPTDFKLSHEHLQDGQGGLPLEALPKAVNDAISVASRIGYRYIWVDSLCILQDSQEDKQKECAVMESVYRNADLTIVINPVNDSSNTTTPKGLSQDSTTNPTLATEAFTTASQSHLSHTNNNDSSLADAMIDWCTPGFAWDTRAWSLQDRLLSRRILYLTGEQMYWECNSLKASETFPRGLPPLVWEKAHSKAKREVPSWPWAGMSSKLRRDCQFPKKEGPMERDNGRAKLQGVEDAKTTLFGDRDFEFDFEFQHGKRWPHAGQLHMKEAAAMDGNMGMTGRVYCGIRENY
ncbi:hypothetical protein K469DRAFT_696412 [Zopfia rhizophila CBS 207.26]|uniref:Protein kinase domain-containing protein n=1 Tax=Zopfia rhizophila CBS 207.26 TaxID=1314779 RepID=A0A6A6DHA5_9PEZI|nr:hypothetical protein K469DRAFT_696412 [Zopfia rhizophila CBS 207.26]